MTLSAQPHITVLRDEPLFKATPYESSSDTFAYEAFAKALLNVLNNNDPPISIGLFGPWGIGKSTIVNILFSKIRSDESSQLFPIYFNAWKYSGDSFRRQFLLDIASAVYGSKDDQRVRRLERLNYTDVLVQRPDTSWLSELKEIVTGNVIRTKRSGLIRIITGLVLILIGALFSFLSSSSYPVIVGLIATLVVFVFKMKFEDVFVIEENRAFDPKLIFPEQFEKEFQTLVNPSLLGGRKAVIVIDDIDRCDSSTIKDILISTKNFIGHTNAFFIVPCDDLNVINIFEDPAHRSGYRDEMLRKYFNVGLRIPPISNKDLIDFANRMARETKLPEDIIQLAVIADYRDARRIKHFANNFLLKLQIARARSQSGYLPTITADRELQLAKLVIIEDCAPPIFARLVQNPGILQILEASAISPNTMLEQLGEHELQNWSTDFPGLRKALLGARYVTIPDLELLLSLKADNLELKVPSGAQFRAALLQGAQDSLNSFLSEIAARSAQQPLADLIDDSLRRATGPLLSNCIASTLFLPLRAFFQPDDARRIARQLNQQLLREDQRVWLQSTPRIMEIVDLFESELTQRLYAKYLSELKVTTDQPSNLVETVALLHPRINDSFKTELVITLNEKCLAWCSSEPGLAAISALLREKLDARDQIFPSNQILQAILKAFNPLSGDVTTNQLRKDILFSNWNPEYGKTLCSILWTVIQQQHSTSAFDQALRLTMSTLCEKPEILQNPDGDQIASYLQPALSRTKSEDDRNLVRDCMVTAAGVGQPNGKQTALNHLVSLWLNDSDQRIRRDMEIARRLSASDVVLQLVNSQTAALTREIQNPTERTRERLQFLSELEEVVPHKFVDTHLMSSLSVGSESAYSFWEGEINSRRDQLSHTTIGELISKALELVGVVGSLNQRKAALLKLAIGLLNTQPQVEQSPFTRRVVECLWHPDEAIRNSAAGVISLLRNSANPGDVRIFLNAGIHEHLRKVTISSFRQFQAVFDTLVANKDLWNETSSRYITELAVTLCSDDSLKPSALTLLESVTDLDETSRQDVLHVLRNIESTQKTLGERARNLMQRFDLGSEEHDVDRTQESPS